LEEIRSDTMVTRERLHQLVDALPDRDVATVARVLEALSGVASAEPVRDGTSVAGRRQALPTRLPPAERIRRQFGEPTVVEGQPPSVGIADLVGNFWPEDEDPDEFDSSIRQWREADQRP
jgi:hypothetical protein